MYEVIEVVDRDRGIKIKLGRVVGEHPPRNLSPNEDPVYKVDGYLVKDIIFDYHETDTTRIKKLLELVQEIAENEGIGKEDVYTEECMGVNYYQTFNEIIRILLNHLEESRGIKKCPRCGLRMMLKRSIWECSCGYRMV